MAKTAFPHLHAVILCEDYGERLWPIARKDDPSCLAPVEPGSPETLLAAAAKRCARFTEYPLHVVTAAALADAVQDELAGCEAAVDAGVDMMVLPLQRGTAFALSLACARIRRSDPQAVVLVLRADTRMDLDDRWDRIIYRAYQFALQDRLVVLGGQQEEKCVDFSYIRRGRPLDGEGEAYEVKAFGADAPENIARRLCAQGAYWYTGVMVARAAAVLGEMSHAGEMNQTPDSGASDRIAATARFLALLEPSALLAKDAAEVINVLPDVSYEKAMLEVSRKVTVLPTTIPFSTMRSLSDLDTFAKPTREGNRNIDDVATIDHCRNVTVYSQDASRKIVAVGLRDVSVIELDDMTLVVNKAYLGDLGDLQD